MGTRRRIFKVAVAYWALLFVGELASNAFGLYTKFTSKVSSLKVASAFTDSVLPAFRLLGAELVTMLLIAALLSALLAWGWAAATVVVCDAFVERYRPVRAARLAFWSVCTFAFFNAYYSLHSLLFPYSTLSRSPIAVASGALDLEILPSLSAAVLPVLCTLLVATVVVCAALRSRPFRRVSAGIVAAMFVSSLAYSWLTGIGPIQRFTTPGSIVLLGLDSFQMNRLPVGGAATNDAPHVDALLRDSVRFANAWTPFARTYPSWLSILTGRYPVNHGVRFNLTSDEHLASDNRYLPYDLRELGYHTFHATDETRFSNIRPLFGYQELVHPPMGLADFLVGTFFDFSTANFARQSHLGHDAFPAIRNNRALPSYNPKIFVRNLLKSLNASPTDQPLFVTMHLCGNHWPFTAPMPYRYLSDDPVRNTIRMVDDQVGEIVDYLGASGLLDSATTFVLSDHGDGWSGEPEDDGNTHGDDLDRPWSNRIVLAIHGLDREPAVETDLVRSIDVYPTILELAGAPVMPDTLDGRSLLPLLDGSDQQPRSVFAESGFDALTVQVRRAVGEYASFYDFDPDTRLITLTDDAYRRLMKRKSYMLMRDNHRIVVNSRLNTTRMFVFDPTTGTEQEAADVMASSHGRRMLQELIAHYRLDSREMLKLASAENSSRNAAGACELVRCSAGTD